jgi:hypothetical protein
MDSNKNVTATFNPKYTLTIIKAGTGTGTVISNPSGIDCGSTCSYQFVVGNNVTLTATPDSLSSFSGWSGDATSSNSTIIITMNSDKIITATFNIYDGKAGYFAGGWGYNTVSFIDKLLFSDESRSTLTATLSQTAAVQSACNSSIAGYFAGGSGYKSYIDKLLFSDETRSTLTSTLSRSIESNFACNSTLAGYFAGGFDVNDYSFIDKLLFSDESRSTLTATLSQTIDSQSACNSTLAGYFAGGAGSSGYKSYIDKLLFSDESRSTLETVLSQTVWDQSACNSTSVGYFAGGINDNDQNFIDKLLFSNETRSTLAATLSQSIDSQSACNSTLAGYFAGGTNYNSQTEGTSYYSFIDKLLFSNETKSTLSTTLSQSIDNQSACQSGGIL